MKYGIKVQGNQVLSLSQFPEDTLPEFFIEVTEEEYLNLLSQRQPFMKYEGGQIVLDTDAEAQHIAKVNSNMRFKKQQEVLELQQKVAMLTALEETNCLAHYSALLQGKIDAYKIEFLIPYTCNNV